MPKFTPQQQAAIDHHGHDILVSASAGSGKTTVLVKRIIEEVLHGVPLDQLLVVTFTDAATTEMRERIRQALNDAVEQATNSAEKQALRQQLNLLNTAQISTLHSFCLKVIQKFYYLLDLDPNFRLLADDTEKELIKEQTWANVRDQHYDAEDEAFFQLAEQFGNDRSDQGLADAVFSLYEFAIARPQPLVWLDNVAQSYQIENSISDNPYFQEKIKPVLLNNIQEVATACDHLLAQLPTITDDKGELAEFFTADQQLLNSIILAKDQVLDYHTLATKLKSMRKNCPSAKLLNNNSTWLKKDTKH